MDEVFAPGAVCAGFAGLECMVTSYNFLPPYGLPNGDYQWWVGGRVNGQMRWSGRNAFSVNVPQPGTPSPTVNPLDGRIQISFPVIPNGWYYARVVIKGHPSGTFDQWYRYYTLGGKLPAYVLYRHLHHLSGMVCQIKRQ